MDFAAITSSSLQRARETASIISHQLNIDLLDSIPDLNERHAGHISGLTSDEIDEKFPGFLDGWRKGDIVHIPGGEHWDNFTSRIQKGLDLLAEISGRVLVVAHAGVLRVAQHLKGEEQVKHDNLEGRWY